LPVRADHPNPPNSDQYRRAEYLKAWWGVMNWDKALADFKKPVV
jgi:hypothetical protein